MTKMRAYTLIEMLVVLSIFIFIFGAVISIMLASNNSWRNGQYIMTEQQEARKAMDNIVRLLRQSNPNWGVTLQDGKILFYKPVFDADGTINATRWVIFKLNPDNPTQLIKNEQGMSAVAIANDIVGLNFTRSSSLVTIKVETKKNTGFNLTSEVLLRNADAALPNGTQVTEPAEGEF